MTGHPRIKFDPLPSECLVDQTLVICIRGLAARERVTVRLTSAAYGGGVLLSQAVFVADANGVVDLSRDPPTSGSYEGIDAMGLFWSRAPVTGAAAAHHGDVSKDPFTVTLTAVAEDGKTAVSQYIKRAFAGAGVSTREVRELGLVGKMFEPTNPGPHRTVLVVGGSGGGLAWSQEMAALLASHGFVALALAYFAAEGLPPRSTVFHSSISKQPCSGWPPSPAWRRITSR